MPPRAQQRLPFEKDEKVLCFHGDLLYEAKITEVRSQSDQTNTNAATIRPDDAEYRIHYKGWKASWDDWVTRDRIRKFTEENKNFAAQIKDTRIQNPGTTKSAARAISRAAGRPSDDSGVSSARGSEERGGGSTVLVPRGPRGKTKDYELETEEAFLARPAIKIILPDDLKGILVDDWEYVTKNQMLVPLPHKKSVNALLDDYVTYATTDHPNKPSQYPLGSDERDFLHQTVTGLRAFFAMALPKALLYTLERLQYNEFAATWTSDDPDKEVCECACDVYGAEHLLRLFSVIPEMAAQTNMDRQSTLRMQKEISRISVWLAKFGKDYFVEQYMTPGNEYLEKAKN